MSKPVLLIAARGSEVLVACKNAQRVALASYTAGHKRDAQLLQAIARLLPQPRLAQVGCIIVGARVSSFSQTRVIVTTANALSAVIGCPVVHIPVGHTTLDPHALIDMGIIAARKTHPRWLSAHYDGKPNITKPAKPVAQYHVTAGGIVYDRDDDCFLFVQRQDSKRVGLPKGHQEKGETLIETAKREIAEETGMSNLQFLATLDSVTFRFQEAAKLHEKKQHNYLFLRTKKSAIKRLNTSEVKNLKNIWMAPERALRHRNIYPDLLPVVRRAMDILQRRGIRPGR